MVKNARERGQKMHENMVKKCEYRVKKITEANVRGMSRPR